MKEIYNEAMELIENPNLSLGYLKDGTRTEHHAAIAKVEEKWHYETIAEYANGGKDVEKVIDVQGVEAKDAWDEEIPIQIYVLYTQAELDAIAGVTGYPTIEDRLAVLEKGNEKLNSMEPAIDELVLMMAELIGG